MKGGLAGDEGAVKVVLYVCGGVRGVGGESTMMILSFLCVRVGRRAGAGERFDLDARRCSFPSSAADE